MAVELILFGLVVAFFAFHAGRFVQVQRLRRLASRVPGDIKARATLERLLDHDQHNRHI